MSNAEATKSGYSGQHAWSQQPQGNASSANGTNFNASSYNYQSGGDYGGGYQQYDGGDIPVGQQDWFHDCQGCECCSGYKYNCICCEVDANGYQHSDCCTYCFYGGSNSYAGGNSNSNSNYGYNNQLGSRAATNNTASLNTKATEWVPGQSFMPQQQAAAQTATQYPNTVFKAGNVHFPKSNTPPPAAATAGRRYVICPVYNIIDFISSLFLSVFVDFPCLRCTVRNYCIYHSDGPPLCQFMVKNGFCRSGAKCKFKHP